MFISFNFLSALSKQCLNYFLVLFGGLIYSFSIFSLSTDIIVFLIVIAGVASPLFSILVGDLVERASSSASVG
jgi:hypothetical protein